jgi:hypothetical protein
VVGSGLGRVCQRVRIAAARLNFWSIRSPLQGKQQPFGLRPIYELKALPRRQLRRELVEVVPTHTGVRDFSNLVLEWRRDQTNQFAVEGGNEDLRTLVTRALLRRRHSDPPLRYFNWGAPDDLEDLFRGLTWELMVEGSTHLVVFWCDSKDLAPPAKLPQFLITHPPNLRRRRAKLGGYTVEVLKSWPGGEVEEMTVVDEDIFEFRWPLPGIAKGGVSPVDRVVELHLRSSELMDLSVAVMRSHAETGDRSLRTERARWVRLSEITEEMGRVNLAIQAELFQFAYSQPMTRFFDVYQVLKLHHRHAVVREYLLDRFNRFVERFSAIAQPGAEPCRLSLVGYPAAGEIQAALQRFAAREIDAEEAVRTCTPQKLE